MNRIAAFLGWHTGYIISSIRSRIYRLAWWYVVKHHDRNPSLARLTELQLRLRRHSREPECFQEVNELIDKITNDIEKPVELIKQ